MSEKGGGFHFGNIGGSVSQSAGGDIVGGDKTTTTTTTIQKGFAGEEQKQQFHSEIEQLREALRAMKTEIEASSSLDQDKKDEVISEHPPAGEGAQGSERENSGRSTWEGSARQGCDGD
jgi:hypothetical protein